MTQSQAINEFELFITERSYEYGTALAKVLNASVPTDPDPLNDFVGDFIKKNGTAAEPILQEALQVMVNSQSASAKSGGFDWNNLLTTVGGVVSSIFGGGGSEQAQAVAQAAIDSQRKTTNAILIIVGLMIAALAAVFIVNKKGGIKA